MKIDEFPPEILMKIFSYLPSYENIAPVNSQFYSVVCRIHQPIICLDDKDFDYNQMKKLDSVLNTTRKITKIELRVGREGVPFGMVAALIQKLSTSIVYLKLRGYFEVFDFLEILSLVPNLVHLVLVRVRCIETGPMLKKLRRLLPKSNELNLHQLKTLEVLDCSDEITLQFNRLPAGVLKTLALNHRNMKELADLFKMQTNLKQLTVEWIRGMGISQPDLLDGLRLESLKWIGDSYNNNSFPEMLSNQTKLKSLEFIHAGIDSDMMAIITTQMSELQSLSIFVPRIPPYAFGNMKKLEMLSELTMKSWDRSDIQFLETFAAIRNLRITSLGINCVYPLSNDLIASLARSVPNLNILRFRCDYDIDVLYAVMKNFNFVEVLEMDSSRYNIDDGNMEILNDGSLTNKQLKKLKIFGKVLDSTALLKKLIKHYPNLDKLLLQLNTNLTTAQFQIMLHGFTKMESLILGPFGGTVKLQADDLYLLREYKNLKFFAVSDLKIEITSEIKKNLLEIFFAVSCSKYGDLKMAVCRKTMEKESKYVTF